MTREWFTTYCQNAAANVLNKDGKVRFTYSQLKSALDAAADHNVSGINNEILNLDDNIQKLCNSRNGHPTLTENDSYALLLTLCNIHAAYLMLTGAWLEESKPRTEGGVDEYGFEIF